jgi:hypothetical protein
MVGKDTTAIEAQLAALSPAAVTPLVRSALGGEAWSLRDWRYERLHRTYGGATGGIFRLTGMAQADHEERAWSIILKVVSPAAWLSMTAGRPTASSHPLYWKREVLAYQSGWLDRLPGGLRAPRCLGVEEQADGTIWLWLEEAQDCYGGDWPLEQYARAARCLGRFNGAYQASEAWPPYPWLGRSVEPRGVIEAFNWIEPLVRDPASWAHPLLRGAFSPALVARLPELWDHRHALLEAFERLDQTVNHHDAWRGNAFALDADPDGLVMIDWAYAGIGVLGADLGDLAVAGYPLLASAPAPAAIDAAVFDAYVDGLREAGCQVPRRHVRFAYITYAALKYGCLLIWLRDFGDEQQQAFWERFAGQPISAWLEKQALILDHQMNLLDEAQRLLPQL